MDALVDLAGKLQSYVVVEDPRYVLPECLEFVHLARASQPRLVEDLQRKKLSGCARSWVRRVGRTAVARLLFGVVEPRNSRNCSSSGSIDKKTICIGKELD